ncbi:MAG: glycogen/starch/alpha-glucan phosphorylase, partial [Cyanobacteria bacterium J06607_15]
AEVVNNDLEISDRLKIVFLADYNVKLAQRVYPAADLSEQISMAGKEASGTGNMKFALNGGLIIGTLDGANVEIRQEVGEENFFLFGLESDEVKQLQAEGYNPRKYYQNNPELKQALDALAAGKFSGGDQKLFQPIVDNLLNSDPYLLLADFQSYIDCQSRVSEAFTNKVAWTKMSILNVARMGKFSSDRAIQEYCDDIWHVQPVPVEIAEYSSANAVLQAN